MKLEFMHLIKLILSADSRKPMTHCLKLKSLSIKLRILFFSFHFTVENS